MENFQAEGGCACGKVRYRMNRAPIIVHCCHCRWCQRETGASFALNALLESSELELLQGETERVEIPTESGKGQAIVRCSDCRIALWSHYSSAGDKTSLVRIGTLDDPDLLSPDVHIFTASKQPWVLIPDGAPAFEEFYVVKDLWPEEALARWVAAVKS